MSGGEYDRAEGREIHESYVFLMEKLRGGDGVMINILLIMFMS